MNIQLSDVHMHIRWNNDHIWTSFEQIYIRWIDEYHTCFIDGHDVINSISRVVFSWKGILLWNYLSPVGHLTSRTNTMQCIAIPKEVSSLWSQWWSPPKDGLSNMLASELWNTHQTCQSGIIFQGCIGKAYFIIFLIKFNSTIFWNY